MRSIWKSFLFFSLTSFCFWAGDHFFRNIGHSFTELAINHELEKGFSTLPSDLQRLHHQKFRFLGKGSQTFAFVSCDEKYVIKFLRFDHLRPKFFVRFFSFLPLPYIQNRIEKSHREIRELLESFDIARNDLKNETCVIHFQTKKLQSPLYLIDPMGLTHKISRAPFLIQPYAEPLKDHLDSLSESELKMIIDQFIEYLSKRIDLNIYDKDPNLFTNFGILDKKLIQFDIGRFYKMPNSKTLEEKKEEIRWVASQIWPHTESKFPWLKDYFEQRLQQL